MKTRPSFDASINFMTTQEHRVAGENYAESLMLPDNAPAFRIIWEAGLKGLGLIK